MVVDTTGGGKMIRYYIAIILFLIPVSGSTTVQDKGYGKDSVIRQADRILIESKNPGSLFRLFTETLYLPIAWPLRDQGTYTSGSVSAGDVTLEFFRYGTGENMPSEARFTSLSLEPYSMEEALRKLRIMGIPYGTPQFNRSILPDGSEGTAWTTVNLPSLSDDSFPVTLFEYSPLFLNMEVRRKQFGNRLTLNGGGPLGIVSIQTIVLGSTDPKKTEKEWRRFLGNQGPDKPLQPEQGPAFRIERDLRSGIQRIVFKVKSLDSAEAFLRQNGLLGKKQKDHVFLRPSSVQGLSISLTN